MKAILDFGRRFLPVRREERGRAKKRFLVDEEPARPVVEAASLNLEPARDECLLVISTELGVDIEMKYADGPPDWAATILETLSAHTVGERPSKFVVGVRCLRSHLHPYSSE